MGFGTEKLEEDLKLLFPEARIQRMDLDTTRRKYSYQKIRQLREMRDQSGSKALIQIDGGVGLGNLADLKEAGVDVFVVGNTVFSSSDPVKTISQLKEIN
jgi:pentose-5-phosphate-3-epimerase